MQTTKKWMLALLLASVLPFSSYSQDASKALKKGDKAIDFTLTNAVGKEVNLATLLKKGPVVLTWYRGGWCPYCNTALKQLQDMLPEFTSANATLVALTPELPDKSLSTKEKHKLEFEVLSDINNSIARNYGLVFKLDKVTAIKYETIVGLSKFNGNKDNELPIPATYVIDQDGTIAYAYVNPDYKVRSNPTDILNALNQLKKNQNEDKLVVVWSSGDPMVAERVALMYTHAAKKSGWFNDVTLVIWGPSAKLISENKALQEKLELMKKDGVKIEACVACAQAYGVVDQLNSLQYDVKPMGLPLTKYLKEGYKVLTF